jgi:hypothetical protein
VVVVMDGCGGSNLVVMTVILTVVVMGDAVVEATW